jgi:hypothetical protein
LPVTAAGKFLGSARPVAVDAHRIRHPTRMPSSKRDRYWSPTFARHLEHQPIPAFQSLKAQVEAARLILTVRVGAGHLEKQVRLWNSKALIESAFQHR